jgi:selenocysteine-specific elongation factor
VRDWSEQQTLAGAIVLDPDATRNGFRHAARLAWLKRVAGALDDPAEFVAAYVARDLTVRPSRAFVKTHFAQEAIDAAVDRLIQTGAVVAAGDVLADAGTWARAVDRAAELIENGHRTNPERAGLPLTDLRNALKKEFPLDEVFDAVVASVVERGFARSGSVIQRVSHRAELPGPLRTAGETLRKALAARPNEPPSRKELAPDVASQRALKFLIETGEVVEINAELVISAAALTQASAQVRTFIGQHGPATVSELKQALGSSRRIVVPLLEYLDRTFVTLRRGDTRTLR